MPPPPRDSCLRSPPRHAQDRRCCYARSGPIVYTHVPITREPPPADDAGTEWDFYHGSQWVVLAREAAEWLVSDERAQRLARYVGLTYMSDETFVQTAMMHSPHRDRLG